MGRGAFRVLVARSFAEPIDELKNLTERIFRECGWPGERTKDVLVAVEGVKVKMGTEACRPAAHTRGKV